MRISGITARLSAELLPGSSEEVIEGLVRAGYCESGGRGGRAKEFLRLGPPPEEACRGTRLRLFVGPLSERPQCVIFVDGLDGPGRHVYAQSLPDGLDLMARWAPIVSSTSVSA